VKVKVELSMLHVLNVYIHIMGVAMYLYSFVTSTLVMHAEKKG